MRRSIAHKFVPDASRQPVSVSKRIRRGAAAFAALSARGVARQLLAQCRLGVGRRGRSKQLDAALLRRRRDLAASHQMFVKAQLVATVVLGVIQRLVGAPDQRRWD